MSANIDLDDGRSWWAANWAYDAVIECIADALGTADERTTSGLDQEFADWLRSQTCIECGPGLGAVDLRELSPACRLAFRRAARSAAKAASILGDNRWQHPEFFPGWIAKFEELIDMMDAIDRGEPAPTDVPLADLTGRRIGPGWQSRGEPPEACEPK